MCFSHSAQTFSCGGSLASTDPTAPDAAILTRCCAIATRGDEGVRFPMPTSPRSAAGAEATAASRGFSQAAYEEAKARLRRVSDRGASPSACALRDEARELTRLRPSQGRLAPARARTLPPRHRRRQSHLQVPLLSLARPSPLEITCRTRASFWSGWKRSSAKRWRPWGFASASTRARVASYWLSR